MKNYYMNPHILKRITEFLGGESLENATSMYLSRCDSSLHDRIEVKLPEELPFYLDRELDVGRSLWDQNALIAHLDIEYTNFDFLAEPYLDMERSFALQQPVVLAVEEILLEYGILPLHILTGRGHHFIWRIRRDTRAYQQIMQLGRISQNLQNMYNTPQPPRTQPVPIEVALAFAGLGFLMEFLAHRVKEQAAPQSQIPVELTAVAVGRIQRGREIVSIDISEYGDPLHTRVVRIPFTFYRKPWEKWIGGDVGISEQIPQVFAIPLHEMEIPHAIQVMQDPEQVIELAKRASVQIPDQSESMESFVSAYHKSRLKEFHDWFYSQEHEPPEKWEVTYDRIPRDPLPPCVRYIFDHPNDVLLKPEGIQLVVRVMLALGWHPRHIAGLIRSKYERDYGWEALWYVYDAGSRADFYTRLFAGLFAVGRDDLVDFNCHSIQEKGLYFSPEEECTLHDYRQSLLERRTHERLAHWPFNRLFLPDKHL